jgi:uncharacterized protein (TIGR00730 family)
MRVCVFSGSSDGVGEDYALAARELAAALVNRGCTIVYGGTNLGLMLELADAALSHNGRVEGVITEQFLSEGIGHAGLSEIVVATSMHDRKMQMFNRSDAFIALPGGAGTLDEFFESWTWRQIGIHSKPVGLVNTLGYYDKLIEFLNHASDQGFLKRDYIAMLSVESSPVKLLDEMGIV